MSPIARFAVLSLLAAPLASARGDLMLGGAIAIQGSGPNTEVTIQSRGDVVSQQGCIIAGNMGTNACVIGSSLSLLTGSSLASNQFLLGSNPGVTSSFGVFFNTAGASGNFVSPNNLVAFLIGVSGSDNFYADRNDNGLHLGELKQLASLNGPSGKGSGDEDADNDSQGESGNFLGTNGSGEVGGTTTLLVAAPVTATPEPSTILLATTGFLGFAMLARRRQND
jgi:hypothetical protein